MFTRRSKTRKACPTGQIRRKGYMREYGSTIKRNGYLVRRSGKTVRVYPKSRKIFVKSRCIEDRGLPGKGVASLPGSNSIVEMPLRKGELTKFGYHSSYPKTVRRDALKKAASAYGPLSLYHKLDAVANSVNAKHHSQQQSLQETVTGSAAHTQSASRFLQGPKPKPCNNYFSSIYYNFTYITVYQDGRCSSSARKIRS